MTKAELKTELVTINRAAKEFFSQAGKVIAAADQETVIFHAPGQWDLLPKELQQVALGLRPRVAHLGIRFLAAVKQSPLCTSADESEIRVEFKTSMRSSAGTAGVRCQTECRPASAFDN